MSSRSLKVNVGQWKMLVIRWRLQWKSRTLRGNSACRPVWAGRWWITAGSFFHLLLVFIKCFVAWIYKTDRLYKIKTVKVKFYWNWLHPCSFVAKLMLQRFFNISLMFHVEAQKSTVKHLIRCLQKELGLLGAVPPESKVPSAVMERIEFPSASQFNYLPWPIGGDHNWGAAMQHVDKTIMLIES